MSEFLFFFKKLLFPFYREISQMKEVGVVFKRVIDQTGIGG